MHYKFIKLTNGENIIVQTDDTCESFTEKEFISVVEPVLISSIRSTYGSMFIESYIMQPWIKMGKMDVVQLPTKNIIVIVDVQEETQERYIEFLKEDNDTGVSNGDANFLDESEDESFELLMDALEDSSDEDEKDEYRSKRSNRTIH